MPGLPGASPAGWRPVAAGHQPHAPGACRVATTAARGNGSGLKAGDPTAGSKDNHEPSHVSCSALPETGDLAAGLCRRASGCKLADLYQVLPRISTRCSQ